MLLALGSLNHIISLPQAAFPRLTQRPLMVYSQVLFPFSKQGLGQVPAFTRQSHQQAEPQREHSQSPSCFLVTPHTRSPWWDMVALQKDPAPFSKASCTVLGGSFLHISRDRERIQFKRPQDLIPFRRTLPIPFSHS